MQKYSDLVKIFKEAFFYSLSFERVTLFFVAALPIIAYVAMFFGSIAEVLAFYSKNHNFPFVQLDANTKLLILGLFILSTLAILLQLYFRAAITRNCHANKHLKKESIYKSAGIVFKSFTNVLLATILVMALSAVLTILELIPSLAEILIPILSLAITILFIFYIQAIIIADKNWLEGLKSSVNIVTKKWEALLFIITLFVIDVILIFITTLPMIFLFFMLLGTVPNPDVLSQDIIPYIEFVKANFTLTFIAVIITAFLTGFVSVFQESSKTLYYSSNIKQKRAR